MKDFRRKWTIGAVICVSFIAILGLLAFGGFFNPDKKIEGIEGKGISFEDFIIPSDVKVVGIGEATHGNREFQIAKKEVLEKLVNEGKCHAIAFELSVGQASMVNDAIHGSDTDLNELVGKLDYVLYDTEEMVDLLDWMREYNKDVPYEESLMFYGVDMQGAFRSLEYLQELIRNDKAVGLTEEEKNHIISIDAESDEAIAEASGLFSEINERLSASLDINERHIGINARAILQYINAPDFDRQPAEYSNHRDGSMAENLKYYSELEEMRGFTQIIITAHNGHVMKGSSKTDDDEGQITMGEFINRLFEGSYFCIGTEFYNTSVNIHTAGTYDEAYERANHDYCSEDPLAYQAQFFEGGRYCLDFTKMTEADGKIYKLVHRKVFTGMVGEGYSRLNDLNRLERIKLVLADRYDAMIFYYEVTPIDPIHY